ncbi:S-layer homology domain-containing protein [Deinococcus sp.]|uniref:outer membrane protein n=1 Tax=Deinococcus sp. TaxID=47478 RepID=UPI003CC66FD2
MLKYSKKLLVLAASLALGVAAAQATTPATTPANVPAFSDVPAGHWAKDAVDLIVQKGLIQGFPDGTFRGNENLTRYQAALIFYRLLQSGTLSSGSVTPADTTTIANGMQEVSTELASISSRVTDLETLTAEQQTRIAALETQIAGLNASPAGSATPDTTAITARLDALDTSVKNIPAGATGPAGPAGPQGPAGVAGPAGSSANTTALEARVAALEARLAAQPTGTVTTGSTTPPVVSRPPTTTPATTTPVTTAPIVIGGNTTTTPATATSNAGSLYVGANAVYSLGGVDKTGGSSTKLSYGAVIGSTQVFGPVGAQIAVDYEPTLGTINADADVTYRLGLGGGLTPYVGAGLGLTSSPTRTANSTANVTDYSVNGLVGVDYRFTDSLGAFAEAQGRYYLSSNGYGTGLQTSAAGFGSTVKAGLKFFF